MTCSHRALTLTHTHCLLLAYGVWRMTDIWHQALALTLTVSSSLKGWVVGCHPPQLLLMSALRIEFRSQCRTLFLTLLTPHRPQPPSGKVRQIHHRSESESGLHSSSQGGPPPPNSNLSVEWSTVKKDRTATSGAPIVIIIILIDCTVILK